MTSVGTQNVALEWGTQGTLGTKTLQGLGRSTTDEYNNPALYDARHGVEKCSEDANVLPPPRVAESSVWHGSITLPGHPADRTGDGAADPERRLCKSAKRAKRKYIVFKT